MSIASEMSEATKNARSKQIDRSEKNVRERVGAIDSKFNFTLGKKSGLDQFDPLEVSCANFCIFGPIYTFLEGKTDK